MLFEEWCGEHSYLRRPGGCEADMKVLKDFASNSSHVTLVHIPDGAETKAGEVHLSTSGAIKLAAFLWAAGPRSFFADVPPLKGEKAHWCVHGRRLNVHVPSLTRTVCVAQAMRRVGGDATICGAERAAGRASRTADGIASARLQQELQHA